MLGSGGVAPRVLNFGARWEWLASRPSCFTPPLPPPPTLEIARGTHWIRGWVGLKDVWVFSGKESSLSSAGNYTPIRAAGRGVPSNKYQAFF